MDDLRSATAARGVSYSRCMCVAGGGGWYAGGTNPGGVAHMFGDAGALPVYEVMHRRQPNTQPFRCAAFGKPKLVGLP